MSLDNVDEKHTNFIRDFHEYGPDAIDLWLVDQCAAVGVIITGTSQNGQYQL